MSSSYFMLRFLKTKRKLLQKSILELKNTKYSDNQCRICLKVANIPILNQEGEFELLEAIKMYAGIEITERDEYPKYLCNACYKFLQKAMMFRKTAQMTDKLLQEALDNNLNANLELNSIISNVEDVKVSKSVFCKICKLNFKAWDEYIRHKNSKHHKSVRIQCPICNGLLTAHLYKRHLMRHQSASHLICDVCGKLYRKDNLIRHLQLHSYELPFHCKICPYRGRFMESLKIHMRTHTGDKPFSCDVCDLRFLTRSNLNRHIMTHKKDRPFKCAECERGFYSKHDMDVHFKADHTGVKDFSCRLCENKYGTKKALMRHELRVHKRDKLAKGRMPLYLQAEYQKNDDDR